MWQYEGTSTWRDMLETTPGEVVVLLKVSTLTPGGFMRLLTINLSNPAHLYA